VIEKWHVCRQVVWRTWEYLWQLEREDAVDARRLKKYEESGMSNVELGSCQGTDLIGGKHNAVRKDWEKKI
jgi:hypothetical protein